MSTTLIFAIRRREREAVERAAIAAPQSLATTDDAIALAPIADAMPVDATARNNAQHPQHGRRQR